MTIEKLPSGNYRIRQQIDGKRYSLVVPYKPSKKDADALIREKRNGTGKLRKTLKECAREYIDGKAHTLSPATVRGYESILKALPKALLNSEIGTISAWDIQTYVDRLTADGKSPKTVKNYHGFLASVFGVFCPETILRTQLPQKVENEAYMPSDDDVKRILDMAKGTDYEIPLRLACYGLRRSEICALTLSDLDGCQLTINKALVADKDMKWIVKTTKTASSTRIITIDEGLAELIQKTGKIYDGYPNRIYWNLQKYQDELGIPHFPLHYLRHYYATTMHALGISDADIMATGGWKTDHVMKRVYRHEKNAEEARKKMAAHIGKLC